MAGKPGVFSRDSMRRISRAVQHYEGGSRDMPVVRLPRMGDENSPILLGKVGQQWNTHLPAISIPIWDAGTIGNPLVSTSAETVEAGNMLFTIKSGSWVYLAQIEIDQEILWHVIAASDTYGSPTIGGADLSIHTNYNGLVSQALGHDNTGQLKWFSCEVSPEWLTYFDGGHANIHYFGCT